MADLRAEPTPAAVMEAFDRWRRAMARVADVDRVRKEAVDELTAAEGALRALARSGKP